jgi:uncharacterized membrane-anchored protein YitT (DUF2179 family)
MTAKKAYKKRTLGNRIRSYATIVFGLLLYAFGLTAFLLPAKIVSGGISGIASLIYFSTGFPVGIGYLVMNVALIIIAIRLLGASFGIKTMLAVIGLSFIISVFEVFFHKPLITDITMATALGSIMCGAGIGIVFTQGGSTGGTDIIAMIVNKYYNISPGRMIMYLDVVIVSMSFVLFRSVEKLVYAYVSMAISAYVIDLVLSGSNQSVQILIFSKKNEVIADRIGNEIGRGITLLDAQGWFSKEKSKVLLVLTKKYETNEIFRIIKEEDPEAFLSMANVSGVFGEGFEKLKV